MQSVAAARAALRRGDHAVAQAILDSAEETPERCFLAARLAQRRSSDELYAVLDDARRAGVFRSVEDRALAMAMIACAHSGRKTDPSDAETAAFGALDSIAPAQAAQIAFYLAYAAYLQGETVRALRTLSLYSPRGAALRARYDILRGFCYGATDRFAEQAAVTRNALSLLRDKAPGEITLIANAAHALAALVRELPCVDALDLLVQTESETPWTADLVFERFQTLRAIGWTFGLKSQYIRAMLFLSRAKSVASTPGQQMLAHLDHAQVAQWAGEPCGAQAELELADACERRIEWARSVEEEAVALIVAADLYADVDSSKAETYLSAARERRGTMRPSMVLAHGNRYEALLSAATARVYAQTDPDRAVRAGETAYGLLANMNYDWRAGRVALLLNDLTGSISWLNRASDCLAEYDRSSLAAELERRRASQELTPRLRDVLHLLHEGLSGQQIATRLNLSLYTVRNHETRLRKQFNVTHRGQMLAKTKAIV